jgi:hypothetical protein
MPSEPKGRPYGDAGFDPPAKRPWVITLGSAGVRGIIGAIAGMSGRPWPRQLPLDPPREREDYRP